MELLRSKVEEASTAPMHFALQAAMPTDTPRAGTRVQKLNMGQTDIALGEVVQSH